MLDDIKNNSFIDTKQKLCIEKNDIITTALRDMDESD